METKTAIVKRTKKGASNKKNDKIYKQFPRNALVEVCNAARNQMAVAINMVTPSASTKLSDFELTTKFAQIKDKNKDLHANYKKLLREMAHNVFGVWQPKIVMKSADNTYGGVRVQTDVASQLVNSIAIQANLLASIASLWAIFDEYRPAGPFRVFYTPGDTSTSRLYGIGVLDYSNSSTLTTVAEAMSYDTKKIFDLSPYHTVRSGYAEWCGHVTGIPDMTWITTGTDVTIAWWKTFSFNVGDSSWSISATYGWLNYEMEIEFRQMNQGG
jgi:hypothetical protein